MSRIRGARWNSTKARDRGQHDARHGVPRDKCPFTHKNRKAAWYAGHDIVTGLATRSESQETFEGCTR
jgi:ribosome modulation factor